MKQSKKERNQEMNTNQIVAGNVWKKKKRDENSMDHHRPY